MGPRWSERAAAVQFYQPPPPLLVAGSAGSTCQAFDMSVSSISSVNSRRSQTPAVAAAHVPAAIAADDTAAAVAPTVAFHLKSYQGGYNI